MNKKIIVMLLLLGICTVSTNAEGWSYTPLPLLFYTTDTGIAGGGLLVIERDSQGAPGPKNLLMQTAVTYTQKHQTEISSLFQSDLGEGAYRVSGSFGFFDTPSLFYGVGPTANVEESFDQRKLNFEGQLMRRLWRHLYTGGIYRYSYVEYSGFEADDTLAAFVEVNDSDVVSSEAGGVVLWDSRDSLTYPRSGSYIELRATAAGPGLGSETAFGKLKVDLRTYLEVLQDVVCALQGTASYGSGEVPLHRMEELGGLRVLRGYRFGRYKDECTAVFQSELRFPIYGRFGGVVFAGAGQLGETFSRFQMEQTKYSGGIGLRFRPNLKSDVRIRLDVGVSEESTGVYITLLEAF